jgi:hypothetical protein
MAYQHLADTGRIYPRALQRCSRRDSPKLGWVQRSERTAIATDRGTGRAYYHDFRRVHNRRILSHAHASSVIAALHAIRHSSLYPPRWIQAFGMS